MYSSRCLYSPLPHLSTDTCSHSKEARNPASFCYGCCPPLNSVPAHVSTWLHVHACEEDFCPSCPMHPGFCFIFAMRYTMCLNKAHKACFKWAYGEPTDILAGKTFHTIVMNLQTFWQGCSTLPSYAECTQVLEVMPYPKRIFLAAHIWRQSRGNPTI